MPGGFGGALGSGAAIGGIPGSGLGTGLGSYGGKFLLTSSDGVHVFLCVLTGSKYHFLLYDNMQDMDQEESPPNMVRTSFGVGPLRLI